MRLSFCEDTTCSPLLPVTVTGVKPLTTALAVVISPRSTQYNCNLERGSPWVKTLFVISAFVMITCPLHFGHVRCSCLAIFSPQSGHQTSSSRLAVKTDCQTPRCLRLLQVFHSAIVIRTGLKVHGVSSFHLAKCSAFISHSL